MRKIPFELKPYPTLRDSPKPVLPVTFKNLRDENKIFQSICLIDSGADYCTLPLGAGYTLDLDFDKLGARKNFIQCACENRNFFGYLYKLLVVVLDARREPLEMPLTVNFVNSETIPVVGRNFMDRFGKISYINKEQKGFFEDVK